MMIVKGMKREFLEDVMVLWNNFTREDNVLYKELTKDEIEKKFYQRNEKYETVSFCAFRDNALVGFSSGVNMSDSKTSYISAIVVHKDYRRTGIARKLLQSLERELLEISNDKIMKIDIVFFNPVSLEWIIPNTAYCDHPSAPGVKLDSAAYLFFKNNGYIDFAHQNSYYRNILEYEFTDRIEHKISELRDKGISIVQYDPDKHTGFDDLFTDLNSEVWRETIEINNSKENRNPVLIVEKNGEIFGFTGPLSVQKSKRGYFAGIGVHSKLRGYGAGSVLFSYLCKGLKDIGAEYMTLFTGENNPARNIYEKEGFKIVASWADMRKEIHNG